MISNFVLFISCIVLFALNVICIIQCIKLKQKNSEKEEMIDVLDTLYARCVSMSANNIKDLVSLINEYVDTSNNIIFTKYILKEVKPCANDLAEIETINSFNKTKFLLNIRQRANDLDKMEDILFKYCEAIRTLKDNK